MELRSLTELQQSTSSSNAQTGTMQLNQEDFIKLMLTELRNQDPFNPMDHSEMLGQMAQFSTVSGISEINQTMSSLADSLYSAQMLNAATLVGKNALVASESALLTEGGSVQGEVELPFSSQGVEVEIMSASGQLVDRIALGAQAAGSVKFSWDGNDFNGTAMPPGQYQIRASYFNGEGREALTPYIKANVDSVSIPAGGGSALLNVEGIGSVLLSEVKAIG